MTSGCRYRITSTRRVRVQPALEDLERLVHRAMEEGWQPLGGHDVAYDENYGSYVASQAMIKEG